MYTRLTKTTTTELLNGLGATWDGNFATTDGKDFWAKVWRSTNRRETVRKLDEVVTALKKAQKKNAACDFNRLGDKAQNLGYMVCNHTPKDIPKIKSKGAKSGKNEILAMLSAPFVDGVYVYPNGLHRAIEIVTTPVEIRTPEGNVFPMGQYRIHLELCGIPTVNTSLRIYPHRSRCVNSCIHQHVQVSATVCRGEAGGPMKTLFSSGLLYEAAAFLFAFLQSPSGGGFTALEYFAPSGSGAAVPICGSCARSRRPLTHCKHCKIALCDRCLGGDGYSTPPNKTCLFCGKALPKHKPRKAKKPKTPSKKRKGKPCTERSGS